MGPLLVQQHVRVDDRRCMLGVRPIDMFAFIHGGGLFAMNGRHLGLLEIRGLAASLLKERVDRKFRV